MASWLFASKQQSEIGEKDEVVLYQQRSKLYHFRDCEWKVRCFGLACLLRNSSTGAVRFFMKDEKTEKVLANHAVAKKTPYCDLHPGVIGCTWLWLAQNYAEDGRGKVVDEKLGLKFDTEELAQQFEMAWNSALGEQPSQSSQEKTSECDAMSTATSGSTSNFANSPAKIGLNASNLVRSAGLKSPSTAKPVLSEEKPLEEDAWSAPMLGAIAEDDASSRSGQATPDWLEALDNMKLAGLKQVIVAEGFKEVSKAIGGASKRTVKDMRNDIRAAYAAKIFGLVPEKADVEERKDVTDEKCMSDIQQAFSGLTSTTHAGSRATTTEKLHDRGSGLLKSSVMYVAIVAVFYGVICSKI